MENLKYYFPYSVLFTKDWFSTEEEIESLEKACTAFFYTDNKRKIGLNKEKELCLRGFRVRHYTSSAIVWEPVIFNITNKQTKIDEERVKFIDRIAQEDYEMHLDKKSDYRGISNLCFIFFDGEKIKEYLFNANHPYNKENITSFAQELEEHFYNRVLREKQKDSTTTTMPKNASFL